MKKKFFIFACILASFVCSTSARGAAAHKYYTSLAELNYNAETRSVEVSLRVFADDLELALSKRAKRSVRLDAKDAPALAAAYLKESFELRNARGEAKELNWVGMETRADAAWLYFEFPMLEGLNGARLRDRVLFDLFEEQINLVGGKNGARKIDFAFKRGDDFKTFPSA